MKPVWQSSPTEPFKSFSRHKISSIALSTHSVRQRKIHSRIQGAAWATTHPLSFHFKLSANNNVQDNGCKNIIFQPKLQFIQDCYACTLSIVCDKNKQ